MYAPAACCVTAAIIVCVGEMCFTAKCRSRRFLTLPLMPFIMMRTPRSSRALSLTCRRELIHGTTRLQEDEAAANSGPISSEHAFAKLGFPMDLPEITKLADILVVAVGNTTPGISLYRSGAYARPLAQLWAAALCRQCTAGSHRCLSMVVNPSIILSTM